MNIKDIDLDAYKDVPGRIYLNNLAIGVTIKQARLRFGHLDLLVTPVDGEGEKWMESHRVSVTW
jgi:hypothetical protein